ncbi:unnamed protein product [Phytomonas sp. Hart1]|nr:unnamed protein product [Phytomonas sp. Hart1]|eukprot:CCW69065.1 unnamed protein product [Phytomonas sp. isolate Hart1]
MDPGWQMRCLENCAYLVWPPCRVGIEFAPPSPAAVGCEQGGKTGKDVVIRPWGPHFAAYRYPVYGLTSSTICLAEVPHANCSDHFHHNL